MISKGNLKMGIIPSFSISLESCIFPCKFKGKKCFALAMCKRWKNVKNSYDRNYEVTKCDGFVEIMSYEISKLKTKFFRIHVGGEFYSQEYLNKWKRITRRFPDITFLAYTTATAFLDFRYKPKNFKIMVSGAGIVPEGNKYPTYTAFIKDDNAVECKGKCTDCFACFENNRNVIRR